MRHSSLGERECERASLTVLTLEADPASQQLGQFLAQVQPQPCTLVAAEAAVHLREGLKQFGLIFGPDADARIMHPDLRQGLAVPALAAQHDVHGSLLAELDGVACKVQQNLAQGAPIRVQEQFAFWNCHMKLETLRFSDWTQRG